MIPGEYILKEENIIANAGKQPVAVPVVNTGDRPVQVGSHFHFFEVNKQLLFERSLAFGLHLDIPAGTAVRFEPGEEKTVELVPFGGAKKVVGFNNLVDGELSGTNKTEALQKVIAQQFKTLDK